MKLLLISDLHLGTSYELSTDPGYFRQANTQTYDSLKSMLPHFNQLKDIDYFLNLGDLFCELEDFLEKDPNIRFFTNVDNLKKALSLVSQIKFKQIHLLGNHDLNGLSKESLNEIFAEANLESKFFGSVIIDRIKLVWLEIKQDSNLSFYLPDSQIEFLKQEIEFDGKVIIFSHYPIAQMNLQGQVYFEKIPNKYLLQNSEKILDIISSKTNIIGYFSGHTHWLGMKVLNGQKHFLIPSFCENIAGMDYPENNPCVYTTLEIKNDLLNIKTFSKKYCFYNLELPI